MDVREYVARVVAGINWLRIRISDMLVSANPVTTTTTTTTNNNNNNNNK